MSQPQPANVKVVLVGYYPGQSTAVRHTIIESEPLPEMGGSIEMQTPFQLMVFEGSDVLVSSLRIDGVECVEEGNPFESKLVREMREQNLDVAFPVGARFQMTVAPVTLSSQALGPTPPQYADAGQSPAQLPAPAAEPEQSPHQPPNAAWSSFAPNFVKTGRKRDGTPVLVFKGAQGEAHISIDPNIVVPFLGAVAMSAPDEKARAQLLLNFLVFGSNT